MSTHTDTPVKAQSAHPVLDNAERQRCEIWTRVMGYHRPVESFNIGKQGEFHERQFFVEPSQAGRAQVRAQA